jgi:hypothetical protein
MPLQLEKNTFDETYVETREISPFQHGARTTIIYETIFVTRACPVSNQRINFSKIA